MLMQEESATQSPDLIGAFAGKCSSASAKSIFIHWFIPITHTEQSREERPGFAGRIPKTELLSPDRPALKVRV